MRASRLLSILITLQLKGRTTAGELARRFEVSRRTILRDLDELSAAGVPIYAERGPGGGLDLLDGWSTRLTGLTSEEAQALMLSGLPAAAADLGLGQTAAAARLKVLAALPHAAGEEARRVEERFHLDPAPWGRRPSASREDLQVVAQAVWECRRLRLRYESWTGDKERTLEPLGVVLKAGDWYFVAPRRSQPAIHRLDRARDITLLDETFQRPPDFDLARAWEAAVASFEASQRRHTARIRVLERVLWRIDALGIDMAEAIRAAVPDAEGWREAEAPIESLAVAAGPILSLGDDAEVLSPPELREELAKRAAAVAALYARR